MPAVSIEVRKDYSEEEGTKITHAVHSALVTAFQIPEHDKVVRLVVHAPHRFSVPSSTVHPELYTFISIDAYSGRSIEAKRNLYGEITKNLAALGIPADHVLTVVRESTKENWGVEGGKSAYDVDPGFKIEV